MAIANETDLQADSDANALTDMPAARDLRLLLDQIAVQIADTRYDQSKALDGMRSRASGLAEEARAARSGADAPELARIESSMAALSERCAAPNPTDSDIDPWDQASAEALASVYDDALAVDPAPRLPASSAVAAPSAKAAHALCPMGFGASAATAAVTPAPAPPAYAPVREIERETTADLLDSRFAEIARRLDKTLSDYRSEPAIEALVPRFDRLEEHVGAVLKSVSSRAGGEALGQIEAQISSLASHLETAHSRLDRLDEIETQIKTVSAWLSDERLEKLLDGNAAHGAELSKLVSAAAEQACNRIALELSLRTPAEPEDHRDHELRALIESFMAERRATDDMTATALDTLQQAMISLLDRVEALEPAPRQINDEMANLGFTFDPPRTAANAEATSPPKPAGYYDAGAPPAAEPAPAQPASLAAEFPQLVLPAEIAQPRSEQRPAVAPPPLATYSAVAPPELALTVTPEAGAAKLPASPIDRIRQDLIADAQRAKARAAAEPAAAGKAKRTEKTPVGKSLFSASQIFGTSKAGYGVPTKRVLIGALVLLVAINGALLLLPRRAATPVSTPPAVTKPADEHGGATTPNVPADDATPTIPPRADWSGPGSQVFASEEGDVGAVTDGDVPGTTLQNGAPLSAEAIAKLQQRKSQAEMSTRLGAAAAGMSPAAYLPEGTTGEPPVTSTGKPGSAEIGPRDLPPAMVGPLSLRVAAANGDPSAEFEVAARLAEGKGVDQDLAGAARWYQRSAARGFAQAQYRLATLYERGLGVKADIGRARIWYARASENGNVKAMHNLAVMSAARDNGAPDYATAARWFAEAAERDLQDSQFNYAVLAEAGLGLPKDEKAAYKWFSLAARNGDAEATRRRDQVKAKLAPAMIAAVDQEVAQFHAKQADRIANDPRAAGEDWKSRQSADVNG